MSAAKAKKLTSLIELITVKCFVFNMRYPNVRVCLLLELFNFLLCNNGVYRQWNN